MKVCAVDDAFSKAQEEEKRRLADYYIEDYTQLTDYLSAEFDVR